MDLTTLDDWLGAPPYQTFDCTPAAYLGEDGWPYLNNSTARSRPRGDTRVQDEEPAIIKKGLLSKVSIHSLNYQEVVEYVVKDISTALRVRREFTKARGLIGTFNQSLKDPGTAEVLDAVLRRNASDSQILAFARFIEEVEWQHVQIKNTPCLDISIALVHPISLESTSGYLFTGNSPATTPKSFSADQVRKWVFKYACVHRPVEEDKEEKIRSFSHTKRRHHERDSKKKRQDLYKSTSSTLAKLSSRGRQISIGNKLATDIKHLPPARIVSDRHDFSFASLGPNSPAYNVSKPRRKRRNKMWHGANGPVYSPDNVLKPRSTKKKR